MRILLVCALWSLPAATFACDGAARAPYADVTQIYFSSDGLTPPVSVAADVALAAGDCPQDRDLWVWRQGASMTGDHCFPSKSGNHTRCCPGTFATDDPPSRVFARLLGVLERDGFYDVTSAQPPPSTQSGAAFEIAVRCGSETTVLRVVVPYGMKPSAVLGPNVARLLGDFTRAVYASTWYGQDIY